MRLIIGMGGFLCLALGCFLHPVFLIPAALLLLMGVILGEI